jgi:glycosyltransferase involved in cell wall biosynthesis
MLDRAGAETVMVNYLKHLDRSRIQMDFLINSYDEADYEKEIENLGSRVYHMCPLRLTTIWKYKKEFKKFLVEHPEYKIIHSNLEERSSFALRIAKKMNVPVRIAHAHSVPKGKNLKQLARVYLRYRLKGQYTDGFACSDKAARWLFYDDCTSVKLEDVSEVKPDKRVVIIMPNAIDVEKFSPSGINKWNAKEIRRELKIKEDALVVGHIGRMVPEKNQMFLIDIFQCVNNQRPHSTLLLIGGGKPRREQKYKSKVEKKIENYHLKSKVKMMGVRDDVCRLLHGIDVLVMPSTSEGFPLTLLEAQAAGVRCVVSDVIDTQVNISDEIQYESLDSPPEDWANKVISFTNMAMNKEEMNERIKGSDCNIETTAHFLQKYYEAQLSRRDHTPCSLKK